MESKCKVYKCKEESLVGIGVDNIPVCKKHFDEYLSGAHLAITMAADIKDWEKVTGSKGTA